MISNPSSSGATVALADEEVPSSAGLARSLYWFLALSVPIIVIFPFAPIRILLVGVLWIWFFSCYVRAPGNAILVFILLFPAVKLLPEGLSLLPGLNFETLIIPLLAVAASMNKQQDGSYRLSNPVLAPVVFYAILLTLSALLSYLSGSAVGHTRHSGWYTISPEAIFSLLKNTVFFVFVAPIAFRLLTTREQLRTAVNLIAWVTILASAQSLWQLRDKIIAGEVGGWDRAESLILPQPNLFGGFLALMLTLFVPLVMTGRLRGAERVVLGVAMGAAGAGLLYSFSRGAWLGAIGGLLLIGILRGAKGAAAILLLALAVALVIPEGVLERASSTFVSKRGLTGESVELEHSAETRALQWKALPGYWMEAPLIGHGFMSFGGVWRHFTSSGKTQAAHSSIVEMVVEEGLLGLIAYLWLIWMIARGGWIIRGHDQDRYWKALAAGMMAAALCLMVLDASGTRLKSSGVTVYLWVLSGGMARLASREFEDRVESD